MNSIQNYKYGLFHSDENMNIIMLAFVLWHLIQVVNPVDISINPMHIMKLDLIVKSTDNSGLITIYISQNNKENPYNICFGNVSMLVANVMCQQMDKGMAHSIVKYPVDKTKSLIFFNRNNCYGTESSLINCIKEVRLRGVDKCKSFGTFGLRCVQALPNLIPSVETLESSVYIHVVPIYHLKCAIEENCLDDNAIRKYKNWTQEELYLITETNKIPRKLLRFSSIIKNIGDTSFLPFSSNDSWQWHSCHEHYHSMDIFATYQIYKLSTTSLNDVTGLILAGHKASFCLEDNVCVDGVKPYFKCSRNKSTTGTQGISPGCSDTYLHDIDCQWIDITSLIYGRYIFRLIVNPELIIAESNYFDNAIVCELFYLGHYTGLHYCHLAHPLDLW